MKCSVALFSSRGGKPGLRDAFTMVEMLVALAVLLIIMGIIFGMMQQTSRAWRSTSGSIEVFRSARNAFEAMTRTLSQATLNTYYDYAYVNSGSLTFIPLGSSTAATTYARNSDLQFVSGLNSSSTTLLPGLTPYAAVTHAVFFQSPQGMETNSAYASVSMGGLVNTCGFYVAYGPDIGTPSFLPTTARYRYRLMQFLQSSDSLAIYVSGDKGTSNWYLPFVQSDATSSAPGSDFVLAENVIALVILPKLSSQDEVAAESAYGTGITGTMGTAIAPQYGYDSSTIGQGGSLSANGVAQYPRLNSLNQLPPVVQVTMVAIDEASALKLGNTATPPNATLGLTPSLFTQASNFQTDLNSLETALTAAHVNFRVFQTDVALRSSKWTSSN